MTADSPQTPSAVHRGVDASTANALADLASPTGIPAWIWLTLLTLFLLFVCWLSLRNATQLLPVWIQVGLQNLADKALGNGRIRLVSDASLHSHSRNSHVGRYPAPPPPVPLNLDDDEEDNDSTADDELPLALVAQEADRRRLQQRQSRIDGMLSYLSGKGRFQRRDGYGLISGHSGSSAGGAFGEDQERILDLPSTARRASIDHRRASEGPNTSIPHGRPATTSPNLLGPHDGHGNDAMSLPSRFQLPSTFQQDTRRSPSTLQKLSTGSLGLARSPTRSPTISRPPSLVAIAEESSVSPRNSSEIVADVSSPPSDAREHQLFEYFGRTRSHLSSHSSTESERDLPDWASARSSHTVLRQESDEAFASAGVSQSRVTHAPQVPWNSGGASGVVSADARNFAKALNGF